MFYDMSEKFLVAGLVVAAVCCLLSCNVKQDNVKSRVQFENFSSMQEVREGKSLDRTKFVLPKDASSFGKKLFSEKTICFTDYDNSNFGARTCTAVVYERGVSIEVDGHKSYFDAEGMSNMPLNREFTLTAMPSKIPNAPWQPAFVILENETNFWIYTSLYNKGDSHTQKQRIEGWYWGYARRQGYKYNSLLVN